LAIAVETARRCLLLLSCPVAYSGGAATVIVTNVFARLATLETPQGREGI
jgi:hypothetical protein